MTAGAIVLLALMGLLIAGIPIAFALGLIGYLGILGLRNMNAANSVLVTQIFDLAQTHTFTVLPLFILMGNLIARARISHDLYAASNAFLGHYRGGLAMATIAACGGFSAVSGSSMATASTMARVAMPPMRAHGYSDALAAGSICAGGTLGILIPPSVVLLIYGILTSTNIGQLFIAGIIPGTLGVLGYMAAIAVVTRLNPEAGPAGPRAAWPERLRLMRGVWPIVALFGLVLGGIYLGVFTPTEAAGIGAAGAFVFVLFRGTLTLRALIDIFAESARTSAMMIALLFGATLFNNYLDMLGFARDLASWLETVNLTPMQALLVMMGIYLVLGLFLESLSMMLLTIPIFFPVVQILGIDPVWFGILVVVAIEISLITPPVGLNVFILKIMVRNITLATIFRGIVPFFVADLIRLGLLLAFPTLVLVLPRLM
ncbi:MAG: TRAP transporter large permease [Rhodobacter sp.]|uniref:TRAP transporter large permease n=1 Tax=Pararhodobacter sp. TaxID=2127056 RepID=UPI001D7855B5|nr:TRAP transporter large permease [Pararhodobacter sp.]MCB1344791.1 TRAP transporter large permease [Paracoccaceae bacterium]MCC0072649.1 TRAP transporter large permease [Rhodobacter sp.]HPD93279.1 TRAP transporter large permease [Pararhodobacter sp.]